MTNAGPRCVVILSSKSAGSSALQNLLCETGRVRHVRWTRHNENETLYWVKAASVLGLPQVDMADSEVPITSRRARRELELFLSVNLNEGGTVSATPGYAAPAVSPDAPRGEGGGESVDTKAALFDSWVALCRAYEPVYLEKTPHHLHQRSALDLMLECRSERPEVRYHFVGLVRNPMDALYSMWHRRREIPEVHQFEWAEAYRNLREVEDELGEDLTVVRYEDVIADPAVLRPVCEFAEIPVPEKGYLHARSLAKWRKDARYGFVLDGSVAELARGYGYADEELANEPTPHWPLHRQLVRVPYRAVRPVRLLGRAARKRLRDRRAGKL